MTDNNICDSYFNCFEPKNHNLIAELNSMRDTYGTENKEYLNEVIDKWISDIESLPDEDKEIFNGMDMWMFLMIIFVCDGFSGNLKDKDYVKTYLNFSKYVKENGAVRRDTN